VSGLHVTLIGRFERGFAGQVERVAVLKCSRLLATHWSLTIARVAGSSTTQIFRLARDREESKSPWPIP
jgi:hypothetical protein